jgi:hypothetical protein
MKKHKTTSKPAEPPPDDFCDWWNPSGTDALSGAHIGGHPDAERIWARKDPGRFVRRTYGVNAVHAWQADNYRQEYLIWVATGRPAREPFVSMALPMPEQRKRWEEIKTTVALVGKPMPKPLPTDKEINKHEPIDFE